MHLHHRWAQATALQVSIALAAMALLTRRKWLEYGMFGVAGVGRCRAAWRCCTSELGRRSSTWKEVSDWWLPIRQEARPDPDASFRSETQHPCGLTADEVGKGAES